MIKLKLNEIVDSVEVFNVIMDQNFKGSLAFKISRLARELTKELTTFNEERTKIIRKYCMKDENGEPILNENNFYRFEQEQSKQYEEEIAALLDNEVEINAEKIPMSCIDDFNLTPQQIGNLEVFFE